MAVSLIHRIEIAPDERDERATETASEIAGYYNLQGARSDEPWDGMNIVVYSDGSRRKVMYK